MGCVLQKSYTMPAPPGSEIVELRGKRVARWRLRNGQLRTAEVVPTNDGSLRVRGRSAFYVARYRDGSGRMVEVATNCRDEVAAKAVLAQLQRRAELVRAGVISDIESDSADQAGIPIAQHLDRYEQHLSAKGGDPRRIGMVRARLDRIMGDCKFNRLSRMTGDALDEWLAKQSELGMAAATRNGYRESAVGFANWCRRTRRLVSNPFLDVARADQRTDRRHQRRALTEAEMLRLLKAARLRPLAEFGRESKSRDSAERGSQRSRATWSRKTLKFEELEAAAERGREALKENPGLIAELNRVGRERELIYRMLVLTGLRKSELASLTVGQIDLDGKVPHLVLDAADEKNRAGSSIPIRAELVRELRGWLAERLAAVQAECLRAGHPIPAQLPADAPLFRVPSGLTRIFDRDLRAAGIGKRDERGRVVDIHALRVTFGTHLCAAGVPLRVAQAAMRHSKPELTANVYTDPKLLDVAGAIAALPAFGAPQLPRRQTTTATPA